MPGLGFFPGTVKRFSGPVRIPHMGWNSLTAVKSNILLAGLEEQPFTYFAHSYYVPVSEAAAATCTYSLPYLAVLEQDHLFGVQFHPEKSGPTGLKIVRNFLDLKC